MTKEEFQALAGQEYEKWQQSHGTNPEQDFYEYEKSLHELLSRMGQKILQGKEGSVSKDKRKKRFSPASERLN